MFGKIICWNVTNNRKVNQHLHRSSYQNVDEKGRRAILRIKLEKDSSYYVKSGL